MTEMIDAIDSKIINLLQKDGRIPSTKIARGLGISEATVRNRIQRLIQEGIIQVVAVGNPFKLGFGIVGTIKINIDDPESIKTLDFVAVGFNNNEIIDIGTIADPALPNMGLQWKEYPRKGRYDLTIDAELISGDTRSESITVYVR